jgi:hypothetical protein
MTPKLAVRFEVVYYDSLNGRAVYWPSDDRSDVLAAKLRECRAAGYANARLSEAGGRA